MTDTQLLRHILEDIIVTNNLCGRSFTYGVAIRIAMQNQLLYDGTEEMMEDELHMIYAEVLDLMSKAGMRTDLYALAEVIDIAVLDEITRYLIGEDDEE